MAVIAVVNPKGGVGKTTLATNLAGWLAATGERTLLGDFDRQQSAAHWLQRRPASVAKIESFESRDGVQRPPKGVAHAVLDSPAQIAGKHLHKLVRVADRILVPLQPSMFDLLATRRFLGELEQQFADRGSFERTVAIVGMRVDARTRSADEFARFVDGFGLAVAAQLRDTQRYVQLAAHGLTLFDLPAHRVEQDLESWAPMQRWVAG